MDQHTKRHFTEGSSGRAVKPPTFSVIVAAYQAAQTIGDALTSALAQSAPAEEIIVCDDGSTDDLETALAPFRDRITVLRKANGGEASAKNMAVHAASGEFVAILDADDRYLPSRLERLGELARRRPELDILTTDAWLEVAGRVIRRCYTDEWTFAFDSQREEILRRNFIFGLAAVRREELLAAGGFDETIQRTTDWDCWIRMILDGGRAGAVLEPLAHYRIRRESLSTDRLGMREGGVIALGKARANPALRPQERSIVDDSLHRFDREIRLLRARQALVRAEPEVRARMLTLARDRDRPRRTRILATMAALAPGIAGRVERRRASRSWVGAGGTRVDRG